MMEEDNRLLKDSLVNLLQNEISCARALFKSLESERVALSNLDNKLAFINSANKQALLEGLQNASEARIGFMDEHGLTYIPAVIEEYKISPNSNAQLDILFIQLSEIAQQCFSENRLIGQLINRRTQFITQTLSSLSPSSNSNGLTYEENGSTSNGNSQRASFFYLTKV